jgi:exodeoxyribonuclease-3
MALGRPLVKIATWNINGLNKRLEVVLGWLSVARPDVVALQETKTGDAVPGALPGDADDRQARYVEAAIGGVLFASIYLPNGNPQPGPKFDDKLAWFERLIAHAATLIASGHPVALIGDFNVVPTARDIYATRSYDDNALLQPRTRAAWERLLAQGWLDALRTKHPDETIFTFWDYLRNRWPRDAGLRIDHLLLSPSLAKRLRRAEVDRDWRGVDGASDHAPVWIDIR